MSVEIVYERQFLKVPMSSCDEPWIVPLVLTGSSNCTEITDSGRTRRERHWTPKYFNGPNQMPIIASKLMLDKVKGMCEGDLHFRWRNDYLTDEQFVRFYENGIKAAKTLEELQAMAVNRVQMQGYISYWKGSEHKTYGKRILYTSRDVFDFLAFAKDELLRRGEGVKLYICLEFEGDKPVSVPKQPRVQNAPKEKTGPYWAIKIKDRGYIRKLAAGTLAFCVDPQYGKQFDTEKQAKKWYDEKIKGRFRITLESIEQKERGCSVT